MDRVIVYPAAIPLVEDLLNVQRSVMAAFGYLAQAVLGTGTVVDGLACGPVSPASLTLEVGPGAMTSFGVVDATAFSTLAASGNPLLRMGITSGYTSLAFVAPTGPGTSVDYLIQASFEEVDAVPVVLPYYNAANPAVPYAGPGGAGAAQATVRQQTVALQLKAGAAAVSGSQVAPGADAGWTPLYVISVPAGTTALTAANISVAAGAPFIGAKLTALASAASLAAEVTRAEQAEATLNENVGAEAAARAGADTAISTALDALSKSTATSFTGVNATLAAQEAQVVALDTVPTTLACYGTPGTYTYTVPTTPRGSHHCRVTVTGGGAGGGASCADGAGNGGGTYPGGGGGAGGTEVCVLDLPCGLEIQITVGAPGAGGVNGGNGTDGGVSAFGGYVVSTGGAGAYGGLVGTAGGGGGTGYGPGLGTPGGWGTDGAVAGLDYGGGAGGASYWGGGGRGGTGGGTGAAAYGSGGGGGYLGENAPGAAGQAGVVVVEA